MNLNFKIIALGVLLSVVFYVSGLLVILTPLPFLYVFLSCDRKNGLVAMLFSSALIVGNYVFLLQGGVAESLSFMKYIAVPGSGMTGFFSPNLVTLAGIGYYTFFLTIAFVLSEGAARRFDLLKLGGFALLSGLFVITLFVVAIDLTGAVDGIASVRSQAKLVIAEVVKFNQVAGQNSNEMSFISGHVDEIANFFIGLIPSLIFVFSLLTVVVNLLIGRRIIRVKHAFSHIHNVARFRLPDIMVWMVIVSGMAFFASRYATAMGWLQMPSANLLITMAALYFFQGLAVVVYFLQKVRFPFFKTLAYLALVFFFQSVSLVVVMVGLADVWVNFRLRNFKAKHQQS